MEHHLSTRERNNQFQLKQGDIFTTQLSTILVTINVVGAMGAGIALAAKQRYPEVYRRYQRDLKLQRIRKDSLMLYRDVADGRNILLFPSKIHFKDASPFWLVEGNLRLLAETYKRLGITSLAMVLPGASLGRLDPDRIMDLCKKYLPTDIPIEIWKK